MQETVLSVRGVSKRFPGVLALNNVDFQLKKGEVHALIGENGAGKSTLMKILLGIHKPDTGTITYKGKEFVIRNPHHALSNGICMVHQEVSLIPTVDAAENIWVGREKQFMTMGLLNRRKRLEKTVELLKEWGIHVPLKKPVSSMSMAEMQLVEIARAISYDPEVIIMDEPTSSLAEAEIAMLFKIIRRLSDKGTSIIFISHKLEEIFEVCDRVSVFRDGCYIATRKCSDIAVDELISMIVGNEVTDLFPKEEVEIGEEVLRVEHLTKAATFQDINFSVRKGEIVGFCGLVGAGRTEIMRAIFGADKFDSGDIYISGKKEIIRSPQEAVAKGIGMVSEDRLRIGIFAILSVRLNISMAALRKIRNKLGFISNRKDAAVADNMSKRLNIKIASQKQSISNLSGGNQQKVILARWLFADPKILILDEPTRGIDVGSKTEIHRLMTDLAKQGIAIILISSEMPEVIGMSDRLYVVRNGEIVSSYPRREANKSRLISDAFGVTGNE